MISRWRTVLVLMVCMLSTASAIAAERKVVAVTGVRIALMESFDHMMVELVREQGAAALAATRNGRLLYARGS